MDIAGRMLGTCVRQLMFAVYPAAAPDNVSLMLAPAGSASAALADIDIGADVQREKLELPRKCPAAHHAFLMDDRGECSAITSRGTTD
jgi:hypothetical protein